MKDILNASGLELDELGRFARGPLLLGRFLLILAAVSMLTTPLTQHVWTWDHFLHGGQDFESGMLAVVIVLCLAVLLSQLCKQLVDSLFTISRLLAVMMKDRELAGRSLLTTSISFGAVQPAGIFIDGYTLPLRI